MKLVYLISILFFSSCIENGKQNQKISFEDSVNNTLIGKWGGASDSRPVWEIRKDSIYYFEHSKAYSYKIVGDDMIINLPENQAKFENIHVIRNPIRDTLLFFKQPGLTVQAVRYK
ncbi:hypothetical protein QWZ08_07905 [Ferruginibacter paludis]|uniref:hypothetical protein n=1 Tax=Ferruginibacter paludis TaxID=1310417 RepID=UPI0025B53869|nr:hypothetical protein [Ferruginibacter paludis]MDN3655545.1 hypothetical protein [Ferruginibacter paludis]